MYLTVTESYGTVDYLEISFVSALDDGYDMAVRHQVPNLQQRGNFYYWRPRVPERLVSSNGSSHLALSLKESDYRYAGYMVRRLNLMLFEIAESPQGAFMTKNALRSLFQAEIARMNDLKLTKQSTGAGFEANSVIIKSLGADVEVGWAYRLIEKFGTRQILFENKNCKGWRFLEQSKVPIDFRHGIVATYHQERSDAESPFFRDEIAALLEEHFLANSILNLEKAESEYFRARADILLDAQTPSLFKSRDKQDVDALRSVAMAQSVMMQVGVTQSNPKLNNHFRVTAPSLSTVQGIELPIKEFMKQCELVIANNRENWNEDTAKDVKTIVRIFHGILAEHNVLTSSGIDQTHLAALRQHFNNILTRWGSSERYVAMTTVRLREATQRAVTLAERNNRPVPKVGLSSGTIRRHLGNLEQFLNHLVASGYALRTLTFKGIKPKKRSSATVRDLTYKPDPEQIAPIFHLPLFTGCAGPVPNLMRIQGDQIYHSSLYFVPMLITYLGLRRAEASGLAVADILKEEGIWAIKIRANSIRGLKNLQSARSVPVPAELLRLGFIDYVDRLKELHHSSLFPELISPSTKVDPGDRFYKAFVPLLKAERQVAAQLWARTIHAFRHGFSNTLKQLGVEISTIEDITGHLGRTEGETRYTQIARLGLMQKAINAYPVITGHLERQPLCLLPFVEASEPAPWFKIRKRRTVRRS